MVSLRKYTKEQLISEIKNRFNKIASLLDDTDYDDMFGKALSWLDQSIYTPRVVLVKPEDFINYHGGIFLDVTQMHIDVINRVYFEEDMAQSFNTLLPELGLLPFISGGSNLTQLGSITSYIQVKTNLNLMNRQLDNDGDYELWPVDENGLQMLQLKRNCMTKIEYLPNLAYEHEEWYLYDNEYRALKDVAFDLCNIFNGEQQLSASTLGVGKEAETLINYWEKKLENDKKEFLDSVMITYMS